MRSGYRSPSKNAVKPPQSCLTKLDPLEVQRVEQRDDVGGKVSASYPLPGASLQPKPRRSGITSRNCPPNAGTSSRQQYQMLWPTVQQEQRIPRPASATCMRRSGRSTQRCSTPSTTGSPSVTKGRQP